MKIGNLYIKKAYFGDKVLKPTNAFLQNYPVIEDSTRYHYLTIEALSDGTTFYLFKRANPTITKDVDLQYSLDNGATWTKYTMPDAGANGESINISVGSKLLLKGNNEENGFNDFYYDGTDFINKQGYYIQGTGNQYIYGNIASLVYGDNFADKITYPNDGCFGRLFQSNTAVTKADINVIGCEDKYSGQCLLGVCSNLTDAKINGNLTNDICINMFTNCYKLQSVGDLSNWDVSKVTNMYAMFNKCYVLPSVGDLSNWDVSKVTNMYAMFFECPAIKHIGDLSNWDTSKVTDMSFMLCAYYQYEAISLETFEGIPPIPKNCKTNYMFQRQYWLKHIKKAGKISSSVAFPVSPLTRESSLVLLNALDPANPGTLVLSDGAKSLLTDDDKAIATDKGWTLS